MKRLIWSHAARRDLYRIAAEYGAIDPDLPFTLLGRIEEAPLVLLEYPRLGSPTHRPGVRKWRARKTPFLLFYAVSRSGVEIRHVRHAASDWRTDS